MHANAPRAWTRLIHTAREFRAGELMSAGATLSAGLQFLGTSPARRVNQCDAAQQEYRETQEPQCALVHDEPRFSVAR
jgi:hypothetical protein